jgi:hypothetical protein
MPARLLRGLSTSKTAGHKIVLEGDLAAVLERRWAAREYKARDGSPALSEYVFHHEGCPVGDFRNTWASACRAAGLVTPKLHADGSPVMQTSTAKLIVTVPSRIFHDLRRTGVRNMVCAGVREGVAMAISGHRTREIFERYNIASDEDLRQAGKQTAEHLSAELTERKIVPIGKN